MTQDRACHSPFIESDVTRSVSIESVEEDESSISENAVGECT